MTQTVRQTQDESNKEPNALTWSPMVTLRRVPGDAENRVLISDALHKTRLLVDRGSLLALLASTGESGRVPDSPISRKLLDHKTLSHYACETPEMSQIDHWRQRKWTPSLDYYLWSRNESYADTNDKNGIARRSTLAGYLEREDPPAPIAPDGERAKLPAPPPLPIKRSLGNLLLMRRTIRKYVPKDATSDQLSGTLWHGLDVFRGAREAAARSSSDPLSLLISFGVAFDVYVVAYSVGTIDPGAYYYDVLNHELVLVRAGQAREDMYEYISKHDALRTAAFTVILTLDFEVYNWRYRHERALRNLFIEAGRIAQRLLLAAGMYGLGTLTTPAIRDFELGRLLNLEHPRQYPLYSLTMGLDKRLLEHEHGE